LLADDLEVCARTIQRYLDDLGSMGAPVEHDVGGYYYSGDTFVLPSLFLDPDEVLTLYATGPLVAQLAGTSLSRRFRTTVEKIVRSLPEDEREAFCRAGERIEVGGAEAPATDLRHFDALLRAVLRDQRVRVRYWSLSSDRESERVIDPYVLRATDGAWYVVAWCHTRKGFLPFHLSRFRQVLTTGESFTRRAGFELQPWLDRTFGAYQDPRAAEVAIRFTGWAGRYVSERRWHPSQRVESQPDGSVVVRWTVGGMPDVEKFVLGWGEHAEVLEPAELRARVAERLREAAGRYAGDGVKIA
jgi:predicted DNA-binding transcriptional regulator YafY